MTERYCQKCAEELKEPYIDVTFKDGTKANVPAGVPLILQGGGSGGGTQTLKSVYHNGEVIAHIPCADSRITKYETHITSFYPENKG